MAVPKDPVAAAAKVRGEIAAARLNHELETELALGHDRGPEWDSAAEQAADDLARRFGGSDRLRQLQIDRPPGTSESRRSSRRSGSGGPHGGRRRASSSRQAPATPAERQPKPKAGKPSPPRPPAPARTTRPPRSSRRSQRGGRGPGRRAFEQTGVPGAGRGAASFALEVLGLMIGLALLYLALNSAERGRAGGVLGQTLSIFMGAVGSFVTPRDPLAPHLTAAQMDANFNSPSGGGDFPAPTLGGPLLRSIPGVGAAAAARRTPAQTTTPVQPNPDNR